MLCRYLPSLAPWRVDVIASLGHFRVNLVPVSGDVTASLGRFRADLVPVSGAAAVRIKACCHFTGRSSRGQRAEDTG